LWKLEIPIDHGSIVTTEAVCLTNKVDIGLYSKKVRPLKWFTWQILYWRSDNASSEKDIDKFIFVQSPYVILFRIPGLALPGLEFLFLGNGNMNAFSNKKTYLVG
jgi:hypothetical protein